MSLDENLQDFIGGGFKSEVQHTLMRYVSLYNHQLPQSALNSQTPIQALKHWYASHPHLFLRRPYDRPGCDIYADTTLARKNAFTPQIMKWNEIRPGNFLIMRPSELGGPYVIPRSLIPSQPKSIGRGI